MLRASAPPSARQAAPESQCGLLDRSGPCQSHGVYHLTRPPERAKMTYIEIVYLHLATVLPAFVLGTSIMFMRKGTSAHKAFGKCYLTLMFSTALVALFLPAKVGPQFLQHFGVIHLLCVLVLYSVPSAVLAARRGQIRRHRAIMIQLYIGGLLVAGAFTLAPGRLIHDWVFGAV